MKISELEKLRVNPDWAKLPLFDRSKWKRVRFGDVVENLNETCDPTEDGIERFIGLDHLEPGSLHVRRWGNVADGTTFSRRVRPGQVLFGKRRAYQRKVAVAEFDAVISGDIYVLAPRGDQLLPELLPFLCLSERFFNHAVGTSAGSLSPRTNWSSLASYEFSIPPYGQQQTLAEVLIATDHVLKMHNSLQIEVESARAIDLASRIQDADRNAIRVRIGSLARSGEDVLRTGPFGTKLNAQCFASAGIPIINISAIGESEMQKDGLMFLKPSLAKEFRSYFVKSGDLVFSRVAEIGRCMLMDSRHVGSMISSNLIRIRLDPDKIAPEYMLLKLRYCADTKNQIRALASSGGRMLVNTKTLSELLFSVPERSRQDEIVQNAKAYEQILRNCDDAGVATSKLLKRVQENAF